MRTIYKLEKKLLLYDLLQYLTINILISAVLIYAKFSIISQYDEYIISIAVAIVLSVSIISRVTYHYSLETALVACAITTTVIATPIISTCFSMYLHNVAIVIAIAAIITSRLINVLSSRLAVILIKELIDNSTSDNENLLNLYRVRRIDEYGRASYTYLLSLSPDAWFVPKYKMHESVILQEVVTNEQSSATEEQSEENVDRITTAITIKSEQD